MPNSPSRSLRPATRAIHDGVLRSEFGETSEALFVTQGFVYPSMEEAEARMANPPKDGFTYSRFANPTVEMFERRMAAIEGAEAARATATGMAAVTASLMCMLKAGDHVVAGRALFGGCRYVVEDLLPRFGVPSTLVDGRDLDQWRAAMRPNTKAVFLETPTNPTLELVDLRAVAAIAHEAGALVIVDNVFATPVFQKPLELGADVVVYSTTKHVDGQGRCLGGIVLGSAKYVADHLQTFVRQTGPTASPFNAWVQLKGLETLELRVRKQTENTARVADALAAHRNIERVLYPFRDDHPQVELARRQMSGGGTVLSFDVAGGKAGAFRMAAGLEIVKISNNLGDTRSLITHPGTTTHARFSPALRADLGIGDGLLRLSVGLEDPDDLIEDLTLALDAI